MKCEFHVFTRAGFYASREFEASTVKDATDKVLDILDKLPAEIEDTGPTWPFRRGERAADWTRITLEIKRDK